MTATFAAPRRILHTMLRVRDLDRSLEFYVGLLGMRALRREDYDAGRYSLVFVGYDAAPDATQIELTHNWDGRSYALGDAFGHVAIGVSDVAAETARLAAAGVPVTRPAGPRPDQPDEVIAFVVDPDGYKIELIELRA